MYTNPCVSQHLVHPGWQANRTLHYHQQVGLRKLAASALLFDMDGTLVDSKLSVERAWAFWARRHHLPLPEILAYSHGRPTLATMEHFGSRFAPDTDWTAEADEMQRLEQSEIATTLPVAGAPELLAQLPQKLWAVVTSAPRALAEARILAAGLPLPPVLVPADEISKGKPDPEGFLKAARELNVPPARCLVFEDTPPGVEAGLNANMQVIGLLTTVAADRLNTPNLIQNYLGVRVAYIENEFQVEFET